jgi:predicted ATPase
MRLVSFHVRKFRNIVDSGPVKVDDVTCLVGKNEAGKSAFLQALHHINPAKPAVLLDLLDEYPRWLKKEDEISGEIKDVVPITAIYQLDESDLEAINADLGDVVTTTEIAVERSYANPKNLTIKVDIDNSAFLGPYVDGLPSRLKGKLGSPQTVTELRTTLTELVANSGASESAATMAADAGDAIAKLDAVLGVGAHLTTVVHSRILGRLPRTFYFSTYSQLGGRYLADEVFEAVQSGTDDESLRAAADFLTLARAVPDTMDDWDFEASNAELESVSSLLTKRVKEHWKQNQHLRLRVSLETQKYTDPSGHEKVHRYLQFRVEDTRHDFSNRLDRRSTGFQWFVSFIASFLEFEKDKNIILLLDEPGLSLHARAQMDLLDTIESKLAGSRQVFYSTHSPFMVRTDRLQHARIAEDQGPDKGTTVTNDAGMVSDPDTLFPLQAALGYDVVQSLFIGNKNVLLEGVSDFIYLTMISSHLGSLKRSSLPTDCRLLPAGGATNIPTFMALLGTALDVVVVLDGNTDRQRIDSVVARGRLDATKVLMLDRFSDVPKADIEDLFTPQEYLDLFNASAGKKLKLEDLKGEDRIVKRIARKLGAGFDHGAVAAHFLRTVDKSLPSLSPETLDRFEKLIKAINAALPH